MSTITYKKNIELSSKYDVIVAGSGPAGICAAVSAARAGARTLLVERFGTLGGNLTVGHVSPLLGSVSAGTMYDELVKLLCGTDRESAGFATRNGREIPLDPEDAKIKLTRFVRENGVTVMLCSSVADVIKEDERVTGLVISSMRGLFAVRGEVIIDATGDGEVAYLAGAEYSVGRESDGKTQPCTIEFIVGGCDESQAVSAWGGSDPVKLPSGEEYRALCRRMSDSGVLPSNVHIVRLHRTGIPGERSVNATQYNGADMLDPVSVFDAEAELREQVGICLDFLHKYVPGFENCFLKSSSSTVGVRETRRILGDRTVCDRDVETGSRCEDVAVHKAWFLIDIHNPAGGGQAEGHSQPAIPYDIPYGTMLPRGLEGLMVAGRCISGTHRAHASYRAMAVCMALGEAAGCAAALSVKHGITPRELDVKELQSALAARGIDLFGE